MSVPKFTNKGTRYLFEWEEEQLQLEVSKLHSVRDGNLSCVVTATTTNSEYQPHLYQTNFNPLATRTKNELKKELERRYKPSGITIAWDEILETLCVNTIEQFERGEPVEEIWSSADWERPGYLLNPIIPLGKPTIMFGDPGTGKSELALMFGIIILFPLENNPLNLIPPPRMYRPLLLDYEADSPEIGWRLKSLQEGMNLPPIVMNYRRCYIPFAQDIEQIKTHIEETKSEFLIIDSLGPACGGDLKEAAPALQFFSALRQLKVTSLIVAHTAKNGDGTKKTIYGSMFFEAIARSVWEVNGDQDDGADDINISLRHAKANMAKRNGTLGFNINFADDKTLITAINPNKIDGLVERMGANTRVLKCLSNKPMTMEELVNNTGEKQANIYNALSRLRKANKITKNGNVWGLISGQSIN
jgi:hypothetical protein